MRHLRTWFWRVAAVVFGGVFVYAAVLKLRDPLLFQMDIESFDLLPDYGTAMLALALPWLELFAGLAVITGWLRGGGLLLLNLSLLMFFGAITSAWHRGINIKCGCFGGSSVDSSYIELFIRDGVLLALGLALLWHDRRAARSLSSSSSPS